MAVFLTVKFLYVFLRNLIGRARNCTSNNTNSLNYPRRYTHSYVNCSLQSCKTREKEEPRQLCSILNSAARKLSPVPVAMSLCAPVSTRFALLVRRLLQNFNSVVQLRRENRLARREVPLQELVFGAVDRLGLLRRLGRRYVSKAPVDT